MNPMQRFYLGGVKFNNAEFIDPPAAVSPIYVWGWGTQLNKPTIARQIDEMAEIGIRSFYIVASGHETMPRRTPGNIEPHYLTKPYLEYVRFAAEYAKSKGMFMWVYDEHACPSGMAGGLVVKKDPTTVAKHMVKDGDTYEVRPVYNQWAWEENSPRDTDTAERRTTDAFLEITYDGHNEALGDLIGDTVPFFFTDEPYLKDHAWPDELEEAFREKYGYDLREHVAAIFGDDDDEKAQQVRIDYGMLLGEIYRRNYFVPVHDWCRAHGVYLTGHLDEDNSVMGSRTKGYGSLLETLRLFDVPGVDVIWRQIWRNGDGISVKGGYGARLIDNQFFPRLASSAANQNGSNLAMAETLCVYGAGVNMDDMRHLHNYLIIRGINLINPTGISYTRTGIKAYYSTPTFARHAPGFCNYKEFNEHLARLSYLAALGRREVSVALVIPTHDIHARGQRERQAIASFEAAGQALERQGIDFDVIDDSGILQAQVKDGKLCLGNAAYSCVICSDGVTLSPDARAKIAAIHAAPTPILDAEIGFSDLRAMKRVTDDGALYFLYNESEQTLTTRVNLPDTRPAYLMDCESGKTFAFDGHVTLASGDMAVLYCTDAPLPLAAPACPTRTVALTAFVGTPIEQTILNELAIQRYDRKEEFAPIALGAWEDISFSGTIRYRTTLALESAPRGQAVLELGKVLASARVFVNGTLAGVSNFAPYRVTFDAALLRQGENVIDIDVSNTTANTNLAFPMEEYWEERLFSGNKSRMHKVDADRLESGLFGPVELKLE